MTFKQLTTICAGIVFASSLVTALPVQAETLIQTYLTNAKSGVNFRDQNCNIIETLGYGTLVLKHDTRANITCSVNGKNYTMSAVNYDYQNGYIATSYLTALEQNNPKFDTGLATVNASIGLNIRDSNCKKIGALPNKTQVQVVGTDIAATTVCQVDGKNYLMTPVLINGKTAYMANKYLA